MTSGVSSADSNPGELQRLARSGTVLVLCYHGVSETWPDPFAVTPETLAGHLTFLRRRGYRGVTFSEALSADPGERVVALTFDDGYSSIFTTALPILDRFGMPATAFLPTAFPGRDEPLRWPGIDHWLGTEHEHELLPMSWEDAAELVDHGWEVGSHTVSHPHLTRLDDGELERELTDSRTECERRLGVCTSISVPYGDWDERVLGAIERSGYRFAATTLFERWGDVRRLNWPRIAIVNGDSTWTLRKKTSPALLRLRDSRAWPRITSAWRRLRFGAGAAGDAQEPASDAKE